MRRFNGQIFSKRWLWSALLLLLCAAQTVEAQNVEKWFEDFSRSANYGSIAPEVKAMAKRMESLGLSDALLASRLEEGSRKQVRPDILIASLRLDMRRAERYVAVMQKNGVYPTDTAVASSTVEQLLIFSRAGMTETEIENAFVVAAKPERDKAKARTRALAALSVVTGAKVRFALGEDDRLRCISILLESDLDENSFGDVLILAGKFASAGYSGVEAMLKALEETSSSASASTKGSGAQNAAEHGNSKQSQSGKSGSEGKTNQGNSGKTKNEKK